MTEYLEMRADSFDFNTANHQPKVFDNGTRPVDERQSAPRRTPSLPAVQEKENQGRALDRYVLVRVGSSVELEGIEIEQSDAALIRNYECVFE
jgi:hypothetical protein